MKKDKLDILLKSDLRLWIYPHSVNAECFEEDDAIDYGESRWQLQEGCEYEYELVDGKGDAANAFFEEKSNIIFPRRKRNEGTIKTGIYVGSMPFNILDENSNVISSISLEIRSVKTSYRKDYRDMLSDITKYYTDLVMMQGSPVSQKFEVDNDAPQQTLYQKFAFVKSIVDNESFDEAIHKIQLSPVRTWMDTTITRHVENVKRLNRNGLRQLVSRRDRFACNVIDGLHSLPRTLEVNYKCDTIDTLENQFVKYVLTQFYSFCNDIAGKKNASDQLKNEAYVVCNTLLQYLGSSFFKNISMAQHLNLNSPVLQRKEGYREILQAWLMFDLAAKLNWSGGDNVYEAGKRNVAALYEYWLFFVLLEVISNVFHIKPEEKSNLVSLDNDQLNLDIKQGKMKMIEGQDETCGRKLNVRFYYNRTFGHREDIHDAGSWTLPMRPDYTLSIWPGDITEDAAEVNDLIVHIHFDAKYRLDKIIIDDIDSDLENIDDENNPLNKELTEEKVQEESGEYEIGKYKRADLLKMHAYKDAIRRTSGAFILYPGTECSQKKGFHEIIPGLGAFCISPGKESSQVDTLIKFFMDVKRHMLNRFSQRETMAFHSYNIYKDSPINPIYDSLPESVGENRNFLPTETLVALGYVKDQDHLNWINEKKLYNFRVRSLDGLLRLSRKLMSIRYILFHKEGESIRLVRIVDEEPRILRRPELLEKGYPQTTNEEYKNDYIYLIYQFREIDRDEPEWNQYYWQIQDLTENKGRQRALPDVVNLSELMKNAKKK